MTENKESVDWFPAPPPPDLIIQSRVFIQSKLGCGNIAAQKHCAALLYKGVRTWQQWENGDRKMDPALYELFLIKADLNNILVESGEK